MRRIAVHTLKTLGGIAAVVFFFLPLSSGMKLLLCFGSLAVAVTCYVAATNMEDRWPPQDGDPGHR